MKGPNGYGFPFCFLFFLPGYNPHHFLCQHSRLTARFLDGKKKDMLLHSYEEVSFIRHRGHVCFTSELSQKWNFQVRETKIRCSIVFQDSWTAAVSFHKKTATFSMHLKEHSSSTTCLWQPLKMTNNVVRGPFFPHQCRMAACLRCVVVSQKKKKSPLLQAAQTPTNVVSRDEPKIDKMHPEILSPTYKFGEKKKRCCLLEVKTQERLLHPHYPSS